MMKVRGLPFLALFLSTGTLLCCALPALLVSLGLGAVMAGLVSTMPQIVWVSEHKGLVFVLAGVCLVLGGWAQWRARFEACPTDPVLRESCATTRRWSLRLYLLSLLIYFIGFFFAYLIAFL